MTEQDSSAAAQPAQPRPPCYRHPDHVSSVLCARCDRPICPECMIEAPVGWQCPECTRAGARRSRQVPAFTRTRPGRSGVVGSTNPTPIVLTIIAIDVVVFFLERFGNDNAVIAKYALSPVAIHFQHQYYRAFTAMFLHANFQHIFFNMVALLIVGPAVEVQLGKVRFVALYLIAGLGGSVASYLLSPFNELGLGASGAIMGVMGAYVVLGLRRKLPIAPVVGLIVLNLLIGFTGNIDWRAHLGGLAVGSLLALVYDAAERLRDRRQGVLLTVGGSVAVLCVLALLMTSVTPGHFNLS
jgi:membrane associated rhomboid family serine protease